MTGLWRDVGDQRHRVLSWRWRVLGSRVAAAGNWHSHDNHFPSRVAEPVCHDAGPDEQDEVNDEEDAVERHQHLLINGDARDQFGLDRPGEVVPVHPVAGVEQGGNDDANNGQQPDDEVVGDQRARMHSLAILGEADCEVFGHDYNNRKTGLLLSVQLWDFRDSEGDPNVLHCPKLRVRYLSGRSPRCSSKGRAKSPEQCRRRK